MGYIVLITAVHKGRFIGCLLAVSVILSSAAQAQTLLRGPGAAALDPMFRDVLQKPGEVDLNLAFARRAIELEDFEAAVATLERLLIGRSGLPLIRLELGMLYLRLEAPELAEAYFLQVLDDKTIAADVRARAEILLVSTREANARGSFAMSLSLGMKHQSNAVTKPELDDVIAQNTLRREIRPSWPNLSELDYPGLTPDSDVSQNGSLSISYSRELDGLTDRRFNASLNHYGSLQGSEGLKALDISVTSLRLGFDLPLSRGGRTPLSLNPYFSASVLNTDAVDNYAVTMAGGMSVNGYLGQRNPLALAFEYGEKTHEEARDADKDGARYNVSLSLGHIHSSGGYSSVSLKLDRAEADNDYEAATGGALNLSHSTSLWGFRLGGSLGYRENERDGVQSGGFAPIPQDIIRHDKDATAGLSLGRSIFGVGIDLSLNYTHRESNFPEAQYEDLTGSLNFSRSFQ